MKKGSVSVPCLYIYHANGCRVAILHRLAGALRPQKPDARLRCRSTHGGSDTICCPTPQNRAKSGRNPRIAACLRPANSVAGTLCGWHAHRPPRSGVRPMISHATQRASRFLAQLHVVRRPQQTTLGRRRMRLLTHNLLACHAKGCGSSSNNFPLKLQNVQLELIEAEYNETFLKGFLPKLAWPAFVSTARDVRTSSVLTKAGRHFPAFAGAEFPRTRARRGLPPSIASCPFAGMCALLTPQLHVVEGEMVCPNCSHIYPIRNGIPNMLLAEHEIPK